MLMVCTSCKTSYNVLNHSHDCHNSGACCVDLWCGVWGFVDMEGEGGRSERDRVSRFQISRGWHLIYVCYCVMTSTPRKMEYKSVGYAQIFSKPPFGDLKLLKAFNFISQGTLLYQIFLVLLAWGQDSKSNLPVF